MTIKEFLKVFFQEYGHILFFFLILFCLVAVSLIFDGCGGEPFPYYGTTDTDTDQDVDTDTDQDVDTDTDQDVDTDTDTDTDQDAGTDADADPVPLTVLCGESVVYFCNASDSPEYTTDTAALAAAYCTIGGFSTAYSFSELLTGIWPGWYYSTVDLPDDCADLVWSDSYEAFYYRPCLTDLICQY